MNPTARDQVASRPSIAIAGTSGILAEMLGRHRSVTVVGASDLALTRALGGREVRARAVEVADLDAAPLATVVGSDPLDCIVFYHALEKLRQPARVLDEARALLLDGGTIVAVTSNASHGAIRLAQLDGRIPSGPEWRFDARGLDVLLANAGYRIDRFERVRHPFGAASPLLPDVPATVSEELRGRIARDTDFETLEFVFAATPLSDEARNRVLGRRLVDANAEIVRVHERVDDAMREATAAAEELARAQRDLDDARRQLKNARRRADAAKGAAATVRRMRSEMTAVAAAGNLLLRTCDAAERRRMEAEAVIARQARELDGARAELVRLSSAAGEWEGRARAAADRAETAEARLSELRGANVRHERELDAARVELGRFLAEIGEREVALDEIARGRRAAQRAAQEARAETLERERELAEARAEIQAGREALEAERGARDAAETALAALQERFAEHVAADLDRMREATAIVQREVDLVRSGRLWRLKRLLGRLFGGPRP